jgi:hypothetical protein
VSLLRPAGAPNCFKVDFGKVRRKRGFRFSLEIGGPPAPVVVDARAIGEAVSEALEACPTESVRGRRQPWNDYHLYLSAEDHDDVRRLEGRLVTDLVSLLEEKLLKLDADPVGPMNVRLLIDDAGRVTRGTAMLWGFHETALATTPKAHGEITIRFDKTVTNPSGTDRLGPRLISAAGDLSLPEGTRVVLGREDPEAGPEHRALPGADGKINRRQLSIRVIGEQAEIGREAGANPVTVGGAALAAGANTVVALPVDIELSNGRLRLTLRR